MRPLAIDLFAGLGGWSEGLIAEGFFCVGFDIERHEYGTMKYPGQLVLQDILTLRGGQFKSADLIVASPPCQFFSYTSMPWGRAKALAAKVRADPVLLEKELALFNACFRIQREACEAAGRHIPLIVENVKGAIPWVGRSRWNFGSYHLWGGDVPALMPAALKMRKNTEVGGGSWFAIGSPGQKSVGGNPDGRKVAAFRFDGSGRSFQSASVAETGVKAPGMNWSDQTKRGQDFTRIAGKHAAVAEGRKADGTAQGRNHAHPFGWSKPTTGSKSPARKAASAMIAKIPEPLARHIARCFLPGGYGALEAAK